MLQKSARSSLQAKMRNNRIGTNGFLNQHCALAPDLESMLLARMRKIFLQQNLPQAVIRAPARNVWRGKLPKIFVDCSTIADSAAIRERLGIDSRLDRSQLTSTSSQNPKRRATCCIAARGCP
jgi:hypothetical protein